MIKSRDLFLAASICAGLLPINAQAVLIDFESVPFGTYTSLDFGDATLTYTGGTGTFTIEFLPFPVSGRGLLSYNTNPGPEPFRLDFDETATSFSVFVGDFGQDEDNSYLQAYGAGGVLLDSDFYQNPPGFIGGDFLSVEATGIKYVLFWDEDPFAGVVYWDNMSYEIIPLPAAVVLFGSGLIGLIGIARKKAA